MDARTETIKIMEIIEILEIEKIVTTTREVLDNRKIGMENFKIGNEKKRKKELPFDMIKQKSVKKR